jgi:PAS domain S-box-containing protein
MNVAVGRDWAAFVALFLIMAVISVAMGGIAIWILYSAELERERSRLAETVRGEGSLLASIARVERQEGKSAAAARTEALAHAREAGFAFASSGSSEILVGEWQGARIQLVLRMRQADDDDGKALQLGGTVVEAMQSAIAGNTGTLIGADSRGNQVLAAYGPVPGLDLGVVAKIDIAEIRHPFLRAAGTVAVVGCVLIALGTTVFFFVGDPVVRRIRESEARFRGLFENMKSGVVVYALAADSENFLIKDCNRAAEQILDIERAKVVARPATEVLPGIETAGLLSTVKRVHRSGMPEHIPDWHYQDERISGWRDSYVFRLPSGEVVSLFEDITEKKRAEEELRESEALWRSIFEMQSVATIVVDKNNTIRFLNRAAANAFGYPTEELKGAPFGFPVVGGDVAEIEIIRPQGRVVYAEMEALPMRWGGEEQFLLFIRDVSAHRRAEGDLRKLFQAIEQSPASVMITDVRGRIEYVNPKFTQSTGYTYPEVVGKTPRILKSGTTPDEQYEALWKTISAGQVWRGELQNRKKSAELFWEWAAIAPVKNARGEITHYVSVSEDITQRKTNEERLRHAQKMQAIGELTGGIAHDFNNLLAIILGNLELLNEQLKTEGDARELINDAIWSAERGADLTGRLLAFARRQRLNPEVTDVNAVIRDMTELLRRTLGERIRIHENLAPDVWKTIIDRGQLENALLNLVVNARDAMPDGGTLTIETGNTVIGGDGEAGTEGAHGEYAALVVRDTGTGMPPEVVERVFEPFFTTKRFGEGSGLGLSMVYGFVSQSGGQVTVDSAVGQGTTFRLLLPRAVEAEPRGVAQGAAADGEAGESVVLVVEAEERVRKTACAALGELGYRVVGVADPDEALSRLDGLPRLDLLFTDVILREGKEGPNLIREVRQRRPGTKVLFASGYARDPALLGWSAEEQVALLPKPYRRETLREKVRSVLAAGGG